MIRVHTYSAPHELLLLQDGESGDTVHVDVSLCVSPFRTYPWLEERNTVITVMGYIEEVGKHKFEVRGVFACVMAQSVAP